MSRLRITTPSRLHFGLIAWGHPAMRQFGGAGLMIDRPGLEIHASPADHWIFEGQLAQRAERVVQLIIDSLNDSECRSVTPQRICISRAAPEHVGLGTGTQLSLALARLVMRSIGLDESSPYMLARLTGRGRRSGVGLHGFLRGGLIVDGGHSKRVPHEVPPLIAHVPLPAHWRILLLMPPGYSGLHGISERRAFQTMPPIPEIITERLCRLILIGMLPAAIEGELMEFGAALTEIQRLVGGCFSSFHEGGGVFLNRDAERLAQTLIDEGLHGVGQSSWGPTLYGFSEVDSDGCTAILRRVCDRTSLSQENVFWVRPAFHGAVLEDLASLSE